MLEVIAGSDSHQKIPVIARDAFHRCVLSAVLGLSTRAMSLDRHTVCTVLSALVRNHPLELEKKNQSRKKRVLNGSHFSVF